MAGIKVAWLRRVYISLSLLSSMIVLHEFWMSAYFSKEEEATVETMCKREMIDQKHYLEQSSELLQHLIFSA
jgi:hypothetical protein